MSDDDQINFSDIKDFIPLSKTYIKSGKYFKSLTLKELKSKIKKNNKFIYDDVSSFIQEKKEKINEYGLIEGYYNQDKDMFSKIKSSLNKIKTDRKEKSKLRKEKIEEILRNRKILHDQENNFIYPGKYHLNYNSISKKVKSVIIKKKVHKDLYKKNDNSLPQIIHPEKQVEEIKRKSIIDDIEKINQRKSINKAKASIRRESYLKNLIDNYNNKSDHNQINTNTNLSFEDNTNTINTNENEEILTQKSKQRKTRTSSLIPENIINIIDNSPKSLNKKKENFVFIPYIKKGIKFNLYSSRDYSMYGLNNIKFNQPNKIDEVVNKRNKNEKIDNDGYLNKSTISILNKNKSNEKLPYKKLDYHELDKYIRKKNPQLCFDKISGRKFNKKENNYPDSTFYSPNYDSIRANQHYVIPFKRNIDFKDKKYIIKKLWTSFSKVKNLKSVQVEAYLKEQEGYYNDRLKNDNVSYLNKGDF